MDLERRVKKLEDASEPSCLVASFIFITVLLIGFLFGITRRDLAEVRHVVREFQKQMDVKNPIESHWWEDK